MRLTDSQIAVRLASLERMERRDLASGVEDMGTSVLKVGFEEMRGLLLEVAAARALVSTTVEGGWSSKPPDREGWWWKRGGLKWFPEDKKPKIVYVAKRAGKLYDTSWSPAIHTVQSQSENGLSEWWSAPVAPPYVENKEEQG